MKLDTENKNAFSPPERTYQKIARNLKHKITAGEWLIGERLPSERTLAIDFGVSRTSLREALLALEISGMVEIRIGSGVFVLSQEEISETNHSVFLGGDPGPFEILEVRRMIEGQAAYNASIKASREQIEQVEIALNKLLATPLDNIVDFEHYDREFHIKISEASGNSLLVQMVNWFWEVRNGPLWKVWYHDTKSIEYRTRSLEDDKEIFYFIKNRRPEFARAAMIAHVDRVIQRFLKFRVESGG